MPETPATSDSDRPADSGDGGLHGGRSGPAGEVFGAFLKLGCTAFGGPIAHLGYFQNEFVKRRRWIDEATFADTVALCQFLPGPTSSQVGLALGWRRAGWRGAFAAWFAFTMPSAILMLTFAYGVRIAGDLSHAGWVQGLKVAAVAVVAQAVWTMAKKLCPDVPRAAIALGALAALLLVPQPWMQMVVLVGGAAAGAMLSRWFKVEPVPPPGPVAAKRPTAGYTSLAIFFVLLFVLPWLARMWPAQWLQVFDGFFRAGSLVFGGGHVVLPLLERTTVAAGGSTMTAFSPATAQPRRCPGPCSRFPPTSARLFRREASAAESWR
jgi:chromate transporter